MKSPRPSLPTRGLSLALALALGLTGCVSHLPAPAMPDQVAPAIRWPSKPPADNHGRVAIDVVDGHAVVEVVEGRSQVSTYEPVSGTVGYGVALMTRRLCTTPCVAELPLGEHELRLYTQGTARGDVVAIRVDEVPSAVRVDLGWQKQTTASRILFGTGLLVTGLALFSLGLTFWQGGDTGARVTSGQYLTVGGALGTGIGMYLLIDSGGEIRPSSMVQWELPPPEAAAP